MKAEGKIVKNTGTIGGSVNMPYKKLEYTGAETETAKVTVDNGTRTIAVDGKYEAGDNVTIIGNIISASGSGSEIYNLDLLNVMSSDNINKLGQFLATPVGSAENGFPFIENIDLEDLKQYQLIKASASINIDKNYKAIAMEPGVDHGESPTPLINEGDIFWGYQVEWTGFPTAAISNFLFSSIEIPAPSMVSNDFTWRYGAGKAREDGIQDTENDQHIVFMCTSDPGRSADNHLDLDLYSQELENAGWIVSDGTVAFSELVGEDLPFDVKLAQKESVKMFFTCYDEGGEDSYYHNIIVILDEKPDCFYILDDDDFYESTFPNNRLDSILASRDFPLPSHLDSSIIAPKEKDGWTTVIYSNNTFTVDDSSSDFPSPTISEFISPFSSNTSIPVPQLDPNQEAPSELEWYFKTLVRGVDEEYPEVDAEFTKPYNYLYVYNEQGVYNAADWADLLSENGWTVTQQPVWAGYQYPEGGYKATKNGVIICFGQDEEYFKIAIYKPTAYIFRAGTVFEDGEQAYNLCPNYFTDLEAAGFNLVFNNDAPGSFNRLYEKDGVNIYLHCFWPTTEDPVTYVEFQLGISDTRLKTYTADLNLYFKQQKEESNLPVFKYIDIIENNIVCLTINESNISGLAISSSDNSYNINLSDYLSSRDLATFIDFINGESQMDTVNFTFTNKLDLKSLSGYNNILLKYSTGSAGPELTIEGDAPNLTSLLADNWESRFPELELNDYLGADFSIPYPTVQKDGKTSIEWGYATGSADKMDYFYAESSWDDTYYDVNAFLNKLRLNGWAVRQEPSYFGADTWLAFKKESVGAPAGIGILINHGNGDATPADKIYSLQYFWASGLTVKSSNELNPGYIETEHDHSEFPINDLNDFIGASFKLPYPQTQASGYSGTNWYSGASGQGGKNKNTIVYFEPDWGTTYWLEPDFVDGLENDGWTVEQATNSDYPDVHAWTAYKSEAPDDSLKVYILINQGHCSNEGNDKIYSLCYRWYEEEGTPEPSPEAASTIILSKKAVISQYPVFDCSIARDNTNISVSLNSDGILGKTGSGGSGGGVSGLKIPFQFSNNMKNVFGDIYSDNWPINENEGVNKELEDTLHIVETNLKGDSGYLVEPDGTTIIVSYKELDESDRNRNLSANKYWTFSNIFSDGLQWEVQVVYLDYTGTIYINYVKCFINGKWHHYLGHFIFACMQRPEQESLQLPNDLCVKAKELFATLCYSYIATHIPDEVYLEPIDIYDGICTCTMHFHRSTDGEDPFSVISLDYISGLNMLEIMKDFVQAHGEDWQYIDYQPVIMDLPLYARNDDGTVYTDNQLGMNAVRRLGLDTYTWVARPYVDLRDSAIGWDLFNYTNVDCELTCLSSIDYTEEDIYGNSEVNTLISTLPVADLNGNMGGGGGEEVGK